MSFSFLAQPSPADERRVMFSSQEKHFARRFEEIWQCSPFPPSTAVEEFLDRFMVGGKFNAESFWEFVSVRMPKRPMSTSVPRASKRRY